MKDFRPYRVEHMLNLAEGDMSHVVADIMAPVSGWSWTGKAPAIKFRLRGNKNVHYVIDFTIADVTFKTTGPVTITFLVNDNPLETVRYSKPGPQHYEKAVPAEWIIAGSDNVARAELDKIWTSPDDGVPLGVILTRMGLTEE